MGHTELGVLPKSAKWRAVAELLAAPQINVAQVAATTATAAANRLTSLRGDPSVGYCFWLLTRLASAARGPDFQEGVRALGIPIRPDDTAMALIARVAEVSRMEISRYPASGPFGEMAALALRRALAETVGVESRSLLGASLTDLERAFRRHSSPAQFGELSKRFFGEFYARTLRYYVERELQNRVGAGALPTVEAANDFSDALALHARETARYVEGFAAAWYDKHNWQQSGAISPVETQAFVAHALRKMRTEIAREAAELVTPR